MDVTDAQLRALTGYRLQRATGVAMQRYKAVFAEFGLRRTTFSCLSLIIENPGLPQSLLGETLAIERPNMVKIVDDLLTQRLIRKDVSKADRRAYALYPTDTGQRRFAEANAAVCKLDADITRGLTNAEVNALHTALATLERNAVALAWQD